MAARDILNWKKLMRGKTSQQLAEQMLGDLTGYPLRSRHRSEDELSLTNLLLAVRQTAYAEGKQAERDAPHREDMGR